MRRLQKLINYHTGSKAAMPSIEDVSFGEIVVRHNYEEPQLLIKVNSAGTEVFVPFIASAQISTAIETAITDAKGTLDSDITELRNELNAVSGTVKETYWTSAETQAKLTELSGNVITYADNQDNELSGRVVTYIVDNITSTLSGNTSSLAADVAALKVFSGNVENNYATKAYANSAATTAVETVVGTAEDGKDADTVYGAKAYADDAVKTLSGNVVSDVDTKLATINSNTASTNTKLGELSGSVESMSADVKTYIDNELSKVYNVKGSVATYEALPDTDVKTGDVYNVIAAVGQQGESGYTPAGTNYVWNGNEWDALGGTIDLSNYATTGTTSGLQSQIDVIESKITGATGNVSELSGTVSAFSAYVISTYATSADTVAAIEKAKTEAEIASSAYTDSQITMLSGITSAYVATKLSTVEEDISVLKRDSATHEEVANASAATFNSAYTAASAASKDYTDTKVSDAVAALKGNASESGDTLGELEAAIGVLSSKVGEDTDSLSERITTVEDKLNDSASTWNNAIQGAEFGAVTSTDARYSGGDDRLNGQYASGAELKYTPGGNVVLDLSGLIIDCGNFE